MKTTALTLIIALITSPLIGADNWYDILSGRDPTHTWQQQDGSRTYRYDTPGKTTFESRSAQSINAEAQFDAMLAQALATAVIEGGKAIYEWWNKPKEPAKPDQQVITLFGTEQAFLQAAKTEMDAAQAAGRCFAARSNKVQIFGITLTNKLHKSNDGKVYFGASVTDSDNPFLQKGDFVVSCDGIYLAPGRDLTIVTNERSNTSHDLLILRNGKLAKVTLETTTLSPTEQDINERRAKDAVETVLVRARLKQAGVTSIAWQ